MENQCYNKIDQNFPMEGKPLHNKYKGQKIDKSKINPKEQDCDKGSKGSKLEIGKLTI